MKYEKLINKNLKLELIKRFIKNNNRVPFDYELNDLIKEYHTNNFFQESVGLFTNKESIKVNSDISSSYLNLDIEDISFNIRNVHSQIENLYTILSKKYTDTFLFFSEIEKYFKHLNFKATEALFRGKFSTNLLSSVFEDFNSLDKVKFPTTSCSVSQAGAFANISDVSNVESIVDIKSRVLSEAQYLSLNVTGNTEELLSDDGNFYTMEVTSKNKNKLSFLLDFELNESTYISFLKLSGQFSNLTSIKFFISLDQINWSLVEENTNVTNVMSVPLNKTFKYLRIHFIKNSYDSLDEGTGSYSYLLRIDSALFINSSSDKTSVLVMGPYSFKDELDEDLKFNYVHLSVCETQRNNSYISYYISSDMTIWIPVIPDKNNSGSSLVLLNSNYSSIAENINSSINENLLDYSNNDGIALEAQQTIINWKIPIEYLPDLEEGKILIKRNTKTTNNVFDTPSGWILELGEEESFYKTTIRIEDPNGLTLDLGNSSALLNNVPITGTVSIPEGTHEFKTNQSNFFDLSEVLYTERDLAEKDPLYPYNHKFLIEGYSYPSTFSGNRVYTGVTNFYGILMEYRDYGEFINSDSLEYFTFHIQDEYIYILVNTHKSYSDWINEAFDVKINISQNENTSVYLKAIFKSENNIDSSTLHNFTLKVG